MKGLGGAGILYIKEISDYQNSSPEPCHKRGTETGEAEWDVEMKTEMDGDNEGTEFKETKQEKEKKGK